MSRSRGGLGVRTPPPPPLKNQKKKIGFLSNTGPDPLKKSQSYQASIQCWTIIGTPVKRHLNAIAISHITLLFYVTFGSDRQRYFEIFIFLFINLNMLFFAVVSMIVYIQCNVNCSVFQRRLANAAKKAIAKIPQRSVKLGDKVSPIRFVN